MAGRKKQPNKRQNRTGFEEQTKTDAESLAEAVSNKAIAKAAFNKSKLRLLHLINKDETSDGLSEAYRCFELTEEELQSTLRHLSHVYLQREKFEEVEKVAAEIEIISTEFAEVDIKYNERSDALKEELASRSSSILKHSDAMEQSVVRERRRRAAEISDKKRELEAAYLAQKLELDMHLKDLNEDSFERSRGHSESGMDGNNDDACDKECDNGSCSERPVTTFTGQPAELPAKPYSSPIVAAGALGKTPSLMTGRASPEDSHVITRDFRGKTHHDELGRDMWRQLQRVSIPIFSGEKRAYPGWRAAFMTCVDQAPATPEYKLLQLRHYLKGEALRTVESLGHSGAAYEAAKARLERKYGGLRRQIAINFEDLEHCRPIRPGNAKDLEKLADLLDVLVINLEETGQVEELGNGSLCLKVQKKLTETMLTDYQRWLFESSKPDSLKALHAWVNREAEYQTVAAETIKGMGTRFKDSQQTMFGDDAPKYKKTGKITCVICGKNHPVWSCKTFEKLDVPQRWEQAKMHRLCFRCLAPTHRGADCTRTRTCGVNGCDKNHNQLLHQENSAPRTDRKNSVSGDAIAPEQSMVASEVIALPTTALRTVPVIVCNGPKEMRLNALLDDASTKTYINLDVAAELGLTGTMETLSVSTLNGHIKKLSSMEVTCVLRSTDGGFEQRISAYTTTKVTGKMRPVNWQTISSKWNHLKGIQFPKLGKRDKVDILIGADYAEMHRSLKEIFGRPGEPVARLTPLGWTCIGSLQSEGGALHCTNFIDTEISDLKMINKSLARFWEIEELEAEEPVVKLSDSERNAQETVRKSMQFKNGRYQVAMPWKEDPKTLPNNYEMAFSRLQTVEKQLQKDSVRRKQYENVIDDYVKKGYVTKVNEQVRGRNGVWYLPHFCISKPEKETTKTRIVFDASSKFRDVSLNDCIHAGPKLQRDLVEILLRFRKSPVALACDVAEMYLQIGLAPEDRPYHRFLWRGMDQTRKPDIYQFNRLVFGVNSCPFQAQFVTQQHALNNKTKVPRAAETVLLATYMDDSLDSVATESEAINLYQQLSELWSSAGMHARKWLSNSANVLANVPDQDRAKMVDIDKGFLPCTKTLGMTWDAEHDVFTFGVLVPSIDQPVTKRSLLSKVSTIFDPMGFLAPFIIRAKLLLQDIWLSKLGWDEPLDDSIMQRVTSWYKELLLLSHFKVPRCIRLASEIRDISLHFFSDASSSAYASVGYLKATYANSEVSVRLIASKSRVAPLQTVSIPRLELLGAMLSVRLADKVMASLEVKSDHVFYWSDSMTVLWWLSRHSRGLKTFVANRVAKIQRRTALPNWNYVPSKLNPADLATRGILALDLKEDKLWWEGPAFLAKEPEAWPRNAVKETREGIKEVTKTKKLVQLDVCHLTQIPSNELANWRLNPERFSSWNRLRRVRAWVHRFIGNCLATYQDRMKGVLTVEELADAEANIIREEQKAALNDEYKQLQKGEPVHHRSKLVTLNPFIDDDGLIRMNSRLRFAEFLPHDAKLPIILPKGSWVTRLIIRSYHEKDGHAAGTNHVLSLISQRFWIIYAREEIRRAEAECLKCKKDKARPLTQIMAPLPKIRLGMPLRAFVKTAVDFAGPFTTVQGRGRRREKRYLCLFTCMSTRAVHLEVAYGLDADSFLNAFYRMTCRRGTPEEMMSDNGTNFVGAVNDLKELAQAMSKTKVLEYAADKGIKWKFMPPNAPHFGGVHESMIKSAKRAIYAILGCADITDEELHTAFAGAENLINSRPLTYQTANPGDDLPLTPNHFLYGQASGQLAPLSVDATSFSPKVRWRRLQELMRHFWNRWMKELIPTLGKRLKWQKETEDLEIGDVVIVIASDTPRGKWPMGRVIATYPGSDGHIRTVKVRVGEKELVRPITKLCKVDTFV